MTIENPIGTIKKAIEQTAEDKAEKELLEKPEARHYQEVFDFYRMVKGSDTELFETLIKLSAKRKELKILLGPEKYRQFDQRWTALLNDPVNGYSKRIEVALAQVGRSKSLTRKELDSEKVGLTERFLNQFTTSAMNDAQLIRIFNGEQQLLQQVVDFECSSLLELTKASLKHYGRSQY